MRAITYAIACAVASTSVCASTATALQEAAATKAAVSDPSSEAHGLVPPADLKIKLLYLGEQRTLPPALSNLESRPGDDGVQGAALGVRDSNTTGTFLKHEYQLESVVSDSAEAVLTAARQHVALGYRLIIANLSAATLRQLTADPSIASNTIIFNAGAPDDELRQSDCVSGLLHTLPSRSMLSDALAQFLMSRRWREWLLLRGGRPADEAWTRALKRAGQRFGARIVDEREWTFDTDLRRTAQQELPLFTQARSYDVVLIADEIGDVGEYVPYNTWLPRPVAGTQGLTPVGWHWSIENWGARQLQNRFRAIAQRTMTDVDYAAWVAVRAVSEAVTRTSSASPEQLYAYLLGDDFEIAAFKGRSLSFRHWNGQLRQPIPLVQPRAMVSQSPQAGFLHPLTDLDTLGYDEPEATCSFEKAL